jgi:hypothetical protein
MPFRIAPRGNARCNGRTASFPKRISLAERVHDLNPIDFTAFLEMLGQSDATASLLRRSEHQSIPKRKRMQPVEINRCQDVCHLGRDYIEF